MAKVTDINQIIDKALPSVQRWEGLVDGNPSTVKLDPYLCPAGYWTIGWGHVVKDEQGRMLHGASNKNKAYSMYSGGITREEALNLLRNDLRAFANFVRRVAPNANIAQSAALTSFAFNLGNGNLNKSALLRNVRASNFNVPTITSNFLSWASANGRVLDGLIARRTYEAIMFFEGMTACINVYNAAKEDTLNRRGKNLDDINRRNKII